jgi:hypothetical protein
MLNKILNGENVKIAKEDLGALYIDLDNAIKLLKAKQDKIKKELPDDDVIVPERNKRIKFVAGSMSYGINVKDIKDLPDYENYLKVDTTKFKKDYGKIFDERKKEGKLSANSYRIYDYKGG